MLLHNISLQLEFAKHLVDNRLEPLDSSPRTEHVVLPLSRLGQEHLRLVGQDLIVCFWRDCFSPRTEIACIIDEGVQGIQHLADLCGILFVQRFFDGLR